MPSQQQQRLLARNIVERLFYRKAIPGDPPALTIPVGNSGRLYVLIDGEAMRLPSLSPLPPPSAIRSLSPHHGTAPLCLAIFLPFPI